MQWTLKLLLVRCYELLAYGKSGDFTLECVFHAKEGDRIHGSVKKPVLDRMSLAKWWHGTHRKAENLEAMKRDFSILFYKIMSMVAANCETPNSISTISAPSPHTIMDDISTAKDLFRTIEQISENNEDSISSGEPTEFANLEDKKVLFKVQVRRDQIRGFNGLYTVVKLSTDQNMIEKFCGETFESQESDVLLKLNISEAGDFKELLLRVPFGLSVEKRCFYSECAKT
ncbi:hypothetical protein F511_37650 [Dorcoceras hygrometricum]|uniref:Uncharacterized protein n=1 Tax=Dorcoceras hygrometricum TaxID=472368 RepID=A0A2Z7B9P7_9LAMI|nr:hypothetical protein F511_37650 [Dorcoceras hygrometricum]